MKPGKTILAALFATVLMTTLSACDTDGPLEEAGEKMDDTIEDTGDGIEDMTDGN